MVLSPDGARGTPEPREGFSQGPFQLRGVKTRLVQHRVGLTICCERDFRRDTRVFWPEEVWMLQTESEGLLP